MIDLVVVGADRENFPKLWRAIRSDRPVLGMRIGGVIDAKPYEELDDDVKKIVERSDAQYLQIARGVLERDIVQSGDTAGIVLVPPKFRPLYTRFFWARGIPAFVESPVATTVADARRFRELSWGKPGKLYAGDRFVDGKGLALLFTKGLVDPADPRAAYVKIESHLEAHQVYEEFMALGPLAKITGTFLSEEALPASRRHWLFDGQHGGVIRSLVPHLFGLLYDAGFSSEEVVETKVMLGRYESDGRHPIDSADKGEMAARMKGFFKMDHDLIPFQFEVGAHDGAAERSLLLEFKHGTASLSYNPPYPLEFQVKGSVRVRVSVNADAYALSLVDFKSFLQFQSDGHVDRARAIVKFTEEMRAHGAAHLS